MPGSSGVGSEEVDTFLKRDLCLLPGDYSESHSWFRQPGPSLVEGKPQGSPKLSDILESFQSVIS